MHKKNGNFAGNVWRKGGNVVPLHSGTTAK